MLRMPLDGREETQVLDQPMGQYWFDWELVRTGSYALNLSAKQNGRIESFDFATRKTTSIFSLEKLPPSIGGLAASPGGKSPLFDQSESDDSNILVKPGAVVSFDNSIPWYRRHILNEEVRLRVQL